MSESANALRPLGIVVAVVLWLLPWLTPPLSAASPQEDYDNGLSAYRREDLLTAIDLLRSAADAGHARAQQLLGYIYDVAEENALARRYYQLAAEQGDADGAYGLGKLYATGDGVPQDFGQAAHWYRIAAERDSLLAIDALATAYQEGGLGLERDTRKAIELLEQAASLGHEPSIKRLQALKASNDAH